jgi:hypothetical protein
VGRLAKNIDRHADLRNPPPNGSLKKKKRSLVQPHFVSV